MPQNPSIGEDVTDLMNGPKVGEDVTSLMNEPSSPLDSFISGAKNLATKATTGLMPSWVPELFSTISNPQAALYHPDIMKIGSEITSQQTSPVNLAMMATGGAELGAAKAGLEGLASGLGWANRAASIPFAAEGAYNAMAPDKSLLERGMGALELGGGLLGMRSRLPEFPRSKNIASEAKPITDIIPQESKVIKPEDVFQPQPKFELPNIRSVEDYKKFIQEETPKVEPKQQDLIFEHNTPEKTGELLDQNPAVKNGDIPKPPIDVINNAPVNPNFPTDLTIPKPGAARPNGISLIESNLASPHIVLEQHPETQGVVRPILDANDKKLQWITSTLREGEQFVKGLNKQDRVRFSQLLDKGITDENITKLGASPNLVERVQLMKNLLDAVHENFPKGINEGVDVGYLENYFTHMKKQEPNSIGSILKYYFGSEELPTDVNSTVEGPLFEQSTGHPDSPFVKTRTDKLSESQIEWDINKVFPAYIQSAARVIFDKPAVKQATEALRDVPESNLKDLATWYIKNYSGYDAEKNLHGAWNKVATSLANITARSFIDFNLPLHMLHAGELPANIWPDLGTKYTAYGMKQVATRPLTTWNEIARLGMLQGELKPFTFKTPGERWQSMAYFFNAVERYVKGVAYNGAKRMYLDQGLDENQATLKAIQKAKDLTLTVDPARQMKGLSPESNIMGGEIGSKLGSQFKGIPMKIVEQYVRIANNLVKNPKQANSWLAATRLLAGAGAAMGATSMGAHMFHVNPSSLAKTTAFGPFGTAAGLVMSDLMKGNYQQALMDTAAWAIPGGNTGKKVLKIISQ